MRRAKRADQPYVAIKTRVTMETLGAAVPPLLNWAAEPDMDKWVTELTFRLAG